MQEAVARRKPGPIRRDRERFSVALDRDLVAWIDARGKDSRTEKINRLLRFAMIEARVKEIAE